MAITLMDKVTPTTTVTVPFLYLSDSAPTLVAGKKTTARDNPAPTKKLRPELEVIQPPICCL